MGTRSDLRTRDALVVAQVALAVRDARRRGTDRAKPRRARARRRRRRRAQRAHRATHAQLHEVRSSGRRRQFASALLQRLDALPGVTSMALASTRRSTTAGRTTMTFQIEGCRPAPGARGPHADAAADQPGLFPAPSASRCSAAARSRSPTATRTTPAAIISERMVKEILGIDRDPIGDAHHARQRQALVQRRGRGGERPRRTAYGPGGHGRGLRSRAVRGASGDLRVFLRTTAPMPPVEKALRAAVRDVDAQQPVSSVQTLEQVRGAQLAEPRLTTTLVSAFAVLALRADGDGALRRDRVRRHAAAAGDRRSASRSARREARVARAGHARGAGDRRRSDWWSDCGVSLLATRPRWHNSYFMSARRTWRRTWWWSP